METQTLECSDELISLFKKDVGLRISVFNNQKEMLKLVSSEPADPLATERNEAEIKAIEQESEFASRTFEAGERALEAEAIYKKSIGQEPQCLNISEIGDSDNGNTDS